MIIKLLGIIDIITAICFWIFGIFHLSFLNPLLMLLAFYLLLKGIIFVTNFNLISIFDIIAGILIMAALAVSMPIIIVIIISLFLLQKGIFSLL